MTIALKRTGIYLSRIISILSLHILFFQHPYTASQPFIFIGLVTSTMAITWEKRLQLLKYVFPHIEYTIIFNAHGGE